MAECKAIVFGGTGLEFEIPPVIRHRLLIRLNSRLTVVHLTIIIDTKLILNWFELIDWLFKSE